MKIKIQNYICWDLDSIPAPPGKKINFCEDVTAHFHLKGLVIIEVFSEKQVSNKSFGKVLSNANIVFKKIEYKHGNINVFEITFFKLFNIR